MNKILILCCYYNRPILVKNALRSILDANEKHSNWELLFGDDGSSVAGRPIVENILRDHLDKVTFENSGMKIEEKIQKGLLIGLYANNHMRQSNADIGLILCDDDELHPDYLMNLSNFFGNNPNVDYCYSFANIFNPLIQTSKSVSDKIQSNKYNNHGLSINPSGKVDASQVAWRLSCCKQKNIWFRESTKTNHEKPWVSDTDKNFFDKLYDVCGECKQTGFLGQFKGIHDYQLVWHKNTDHDGLISYNTMIKNLAGVKF